MSHYIVLLHPDAVCPPLVDAASARLVRICLDRSAASSSSMIVLIICMNSLLVLDSTGFKADLLPVQPAKNALHVLKRCISAELLRQSDTFTCSIWAPKKLSVWHHRRVQHNKHSSANAPCGWSAGSNKRNRDLLGPKPGRM